MIVGIDPSFTSTGIAVVSDDLQTIYYQAHFPCGYKIYDGRGYADGAYFLADKVFEIMDEQSELHHEPIHIIAEIPALATYRGAYLGVLHGMLDYIFRTAALPIEDYVWVPCMACNSYTANKERTKTHISDWAREHYGMSPKTRLNNDIATALVFCHLYKSILSGGYNKKFWRTVRNQ